MRFRLLLLEARVESLALHVQIRRPPTRSSLKANTGTKTEKEIHVMSRKALQLGLCLCLLVFATLSATPILAETAPSFGYTESGVGSTMEKACSNAIQNLKDACGIIAPPTTNPGRCWPIENLEGQVVGYICTCEATTLACLGQ
jgi:hypothetical protein